MIWCEHITYVHIWMIDPVERRSCEKQKPHQYLQCIIWRQRLTSSSEPKLIFKMMKTAEKGERNQTSNENWVSFSMLIQMEWLVKTPRPTLKNEIKSVRIQKEEESVRKKRWLRRRLLLVRHYPKLYILINK